MTGLATRWRRRLWAEGGSAAIETAMLFPIFILLVMGGVEFSYQIMVRAQMENAVRVATRLAITGKGTCINGAKRSDVIISSLRSSANVIKVNAVGYPNVNMQVIHTAASVGQDGEDDDTDGPLSVSGVPLNFNDYNRNCVQERTAAEVSASGAGGPGDLVIYTVNFQTRFLLPFVATFAGNSNGTMNYSSKIMVRNEPWGSSSVSTPK